MDALRPLPPETEQRIMQKLRLDWNYHSNSIEGNQLSYGETVAFLMHGLTAKGKPLKDHLDIRGHNQAIEFLTSLVNDERGISEADIRALHQLILVEPYEVDALTPEGNPTKKWIRLGEYKRESNSVKTRTGETHFYATPEETPARMTELMDWLNKSKATPDLHPLVAAALFHHEFTAIHPFDDGNGRMARLLSNLILMQSGYPPVVVKQDSRNKYYSVLSQADAGSFVPVVDYFGELQEHSLEVYLRGAKGKNIDEDEDVDKEIALFKASFQSTLLKRESLSEESFLETIKNSIFPFIDSILSKMTPFKDFFFNEKITITTGWKYLPDERKNNTRQSENFQIYSSEFFFIENSDDLYSKIYALPNEYLPRLEIEFPEDLIINFNWHGFKAKDEHFDFSFLISIIFEFNNYSINTFTDHNFEQIVERYYNETLTDEEINMIGNKCARQVLNGIKQKANES